MSDVGPLLDRARSAETERNWDQVVRRVRGAATEVGLGTASGIASAMNVADAALDARADTWPTAYVEAFERLGHAERYGTGTQAGLHALSTPFDQLSDAQLGGLANSVKGTVMEVRLREMVENGDLPDLAGPGASARLSEGLTQTGHDLEVTTAEGAQLLVQVKAGTWESVRGRIAEYEAAGIPVAVTSETAARAQEAGYGSAVIDTGISGADLTSEAASVVDNLGLAHAVDELVPELAVVSLLAAGALRLRAGQSSGEVRSWMTAELKEKGAVNAIGLVAGLVTGAALLRPLTVVGVQWGLGRGRTAEGTAAAARDSHERLVNLHPVERV